jgi:hypothetical protein
MPNMVPRGLWGTPPGGVSVSAKQVWACLPTETTYRKATFIYGWSPDVGTTNGLPGSWQSVWADAARPPVNASATVMAYSGYVHVWIAWAESNPRVASAYRITRPDGTIAADVSYTSLNYTDTDPRPGTGAYTVTGILDGVPGGSIATNSVTLGSPPTWTQYPYYDGGIAWQQQSASNGSGMRWYKNGYHWTTQNRAPSTNFADRDAALAGNTQSYQVFTMVNGYQGQGTDVRSVQVPTIPPRPQYLRVGWPGPPLYWPPYAGDPAQYMETLVYGPGDGAVWDQVEVQRKLRNTYGEPSFDTGYEHLAWVYPSTQYNPILFPSTTWAYQPRCGTVRARTYSPGSISEWVYTDEFCYYEYPS